MHMIRHNDEGIEGNEGAESWYVLPVVVGNMTEFVVEHDSVYDFAKEMLPLLGANGNKVRSALSVIIAF